MEAKRRIVLRRVNQLVSVLIPAIIEVVVQRNVVVHPRENILEMVLPVEIRLNAACLDVLYILGGPDISSAREPENPIVHFVPIAAEGIFQNTLWTQGLPTQDREFTR